MPSENPAHQAIERLAERQHRERMETFRRGMRPSSPPEREATNSDRLDWARRDYAYEKYDAVIATASRIHHSPEASPRQAAEALRLRAVARAQKGLFTAAIADAESALALDPVAAGLVPAADLRLLVGSWRFRPDRTSLLRQ